MTGINLALAGSLLMLVSAGFDYYHKRMKIRGVDQELSKLQEKDSINPKELPAIGTSKKNLKEQLSLPMIGYILGFLLVLLGLVTSAGIFHTCLEILKYTGAWAVVIGFLGSSTWYTDARIIEWEYYPELRGLFAILIFIPSFIKELCSTGVI